MSSSCVYTDPSLSPPLLLPSLHLPDLDMSHLQLCADCAEHHNTDITSSSSMHAHDGHPLLLIQNPSFSSPSSIPVSDSHSSSCQPSQLASEVEESTSPPLPEHVGFLCNICGEPVRGTRFICLMSDMHTHASTTISYLSS